MNPNCRYHLISKFCFRRAGQAHFEALTSVGNHKELQYMVLRHLWHFLADGFSRISQDFNRSTE
jgi:hypothetical protein